MKNEYKIMGNVVEIKLRDGQRCLVDLEDLEKVDKAVPENYWYLCQAGYVTGGNPPMKMHRLVMDTPKGLVVDHINHLRWDNRKENLINCTASENSKNKLTHKELIELGVKKDSIPKREPLKQLVTSKDVMEVLNVNRQTLHHYRENKGMPYVQIGPRTIRYDLEAVNEWIENQNK